MGQFSGSPAQKRGRMKWSNLVCMAEGRSLCFGGTEEEGGGEPNLCQLGKPTGGTSISLICDLFNWELFLAPESKEREGGAVVDHYRAEGGQAVFRSQASSLQ